ncbi:type IV pilus biogenesis/stability protein PilW [Zhongshania sp. BJYM1]|jgi:type IV pilus assembly protein PilF|uniref:type IV pilus biogenesis/stability protein PilW n=1 Tax=Zhongshania aquatica TaxID=2965069 RepID=UPI0022B382E0|nr:type IV pilus biogenesis/stability protein PilW [Marortus sp. BJYM1]
MSWLRIKGINVLPLILVMLFSTLLLSGCVTTRSGGFASKADDKKAFETSLQLARSYIAQGNWDQAKRHLQYVEAEDKNNPETLEALALVFQNTGELELAEQYYLRSISLAPKASRVRNNYAAFLYARERYQEAATQLEVVVQELLYERRVEAFVNLGRCYMQLEAYSKAEDAFKRAFLMQGDDAAVLMSLAEVYFRMGRYAESQRFYDAYRSKNTAQSAAALWLGIRLADKFDDKNSRASFALALKNLYSKSEEYLLYKAYMEDNKQVEP